MVRNREIVRDRHDEIKSQQIGQSPQMGASLTLCDLLGMSVDENRPSYALTDVVKTKKSFEKPTDDCGSVVRPT